MILKMLHWQILWEICNEVLIKDPITPLHIRFLLFSTFLIVGSVQ